MKKIIKKTPILAMLLIGLMWSCDPEIDSIELENTNSIDLTIIDTQTRYPSPATVALGQAGSFAILSKSGITNVPPSSIIGNVGTSPITGAALLLTCPEVTGNIYTVAAAGPRPCRVTDAPRLTTAVLDMQAAYTDAAGRSPDEVNLGGGVIGRNTLAPGIYKWTGTLVIANDITLIGNSTDVWIFQVAGTFNMSSAAKIILRGGAKAENIFWQAGGAVTLGTTSHLEGTLLGQTSIAVQTGATVEGRLLAQTAVTLQMNTVTNPLGNIPPPPPPPNPAQEAVQLGGAEHFAILSKSGITNVPPSNIIGNVGTSPITGAALLLTCPEVEGTIYTVAAAGPLPCRVPDAPRLTTAVLDMQAAYTNAAGRTPDLVGIGAGVIGGNILPPGVYKWASTLVIKTDIVLNGGPNDVWIFQVAGTFNMSSAVRINLTGGARAENIFWQVSGAVTLGTTSHFEGTLLGATSIAVQTGASVNGRLLAQTAVTLQMNSVSNPTVSITPPPPPNPVQQVIQLGGAKHFAILSKSGITNVPPSIIKGNVGTSPITGAALLLTCPEVTGKIYTVADAGPRPCRVTNAPRLRTAVIDMQAAYTAAAARTPDLVGIGAGVIGGNILSPGVYKWASTLVINSDIELNGGPNDVWIFQVAGTFNMSSAVRINLSGGARAKNIFWQVSGAVTLGTTSHFEGTLLGATSIAVQTGASVKGRLLAQTAVTLQMNSVVRP
jgi:hypothetical protein